MPARSARDSCGGLGGRKSQGLCEEAITASSLYRLQPIARHCFFAGAPVARMQIDMGGEVGFFGDRCA